MRRILGALVLAALPACQPHPTPITLQGEATSIAALRGDWSGEYWGNASERRGALSFSIASTADSAFGDVIMFMATRSAAPSSRTESRAGITTGCGSWRGACDSAGRCPDDGHL